VNKRRVSPRRGTVLKRWDRKERPWYVVCRCVPGVLWTIGPRDDDLQNSMGLAVAQGWLHSIEAGWQCPACVERASRRKEEERQGMLRRATAASNKQKEQRQ